MPTITMPASAFVHPSPATSRALPGAQVGTARKSSLPQPQSSVGIQWKLLYLLWALRLLRPEWLVSTYIPPLTPLRALPSILLVGLLGYWVAARRKHIREF